MVAFKNRYMIMEVFMNSKDLKGNDPFIISEGNVSEAIKESIRLNFGAYGLAVSLMSFQIKYLNPITKVIIFRVSRDDHQRVWSAITMVRSIKKFPVTFNLLDLSGSIKACKNAALKCEEAKFEIYKHEVEGNISPEIAAKFENCLERIRLLEG